MDVFHTHLLAGLPCPSTNTGSVPAVYNLTMDPCEKYDMIFNGVAPARATRNSPGKYAGEDNGWSNVLFSPALIEFDRSVMKYPSIQWAVHRTT